VCCSEGGYAFVGTVLSCLAFTVDGVDIKSVPWLAFPVSATPAANEYSTINAFVSALSANINAGTHGYLSFASGNRILLSRVVTSSKDPDVTMAVTIGGASGSTTITGGSGVAFFTTLDSPVITEFTCSIRIVSQVFLGSSSLRYRFTFTVSVTGGTAPYQYEWLYSGLGRFALSNISGIYSETFTCDQYYSATTVDLYCKMTDASGKVATSNVISFVP
jgi:hypothetical protein